MLDSYIADIDARVNKYMSGDGFDRDIAW